MIAVSASTAIFRGLFGPERPFSGAADGFRPSTHQGAPRKIKIGQSDQREHLRCVLRQSPVAHLRVAELALDDAKHVLDARTDRGHLVVEALVRLGQRVVLAGLERDAPEQARLARHTLELVVHVALVTEHRPVIFAHQVRQLVDVRNIGRRHRNGMHEPGIDVGAHVDLHAEVPLVTLLGLMHLGVALLVPVLRRGGRMDDRGVDHRAALEEQPARLERVVDGVHHLPGQRMLLEQVAELEDRRLVGHRVVGEVQTGKAAHRLDLVECIFHRRIRQRVPLLHEVDPQHCRQRHRRTATPARRRVVRLDYCQQRCPRHDLLHLGQEALPARLFLLPFKSQRGEGRLLHGGSAGYDFSILPALNRSELP